MSLILTCGVRGRAPENCEFCAFRDLKSASEQCNGIKQCVVFIDYSKFMSIPGVMYKKLSYRRETARQLCMST